MEKHKEARAQLMREDDGSFSYQVLGAEEEVVHKVAGFSTAAEAERAAFKWMKNNLINEVIDEALEPVREAVRNLNRAGGGFLTATLEERRYSLEE